MSCKARINRFDGIFEEGARAGQRGSYYFWSVTGGVRASDGERMLLGGPAKTRKQALRKVARAKAKYCRG